MDYGRLEGRRMEGKVKGKLDGGRLVNEGKLGREN